MSRLRHVFLLDHAIELWLAAVAVVSAVGFFVDPHSGRTSIGVLHPFDYVWNALYLLGGLALALGLWRMSPRWQAAGLIMFATTALMNVVALVAVLGVDGWRNEVTLVLLAVACGARVRLLARS